MKSIHSMMVDFVLTLVGSNVSNKEIERALSELVESAINYDEMVYVNEAVKKFEESLKTL